MHIFIDESGNFSGVGSKARPSVVGALIAPDRGLNALLTDYALIRPSLPKDKGEVKGRQLSEPQLDAVIRMLIRHPVFFEAVIVDPALHTPLSVDAHRLGQAKAITDSLTDAHHPNLKASMARLRQHLEAMPVQLYLQSWAMFELVHQVLVRASPYWVQREPRELGAFHWVLDAKDRAPSITPWEEWWSRVVLAILQTKSGRDPLIHIIGADYSHFERFMTDWQPWAFPAREPPADGRVIDLRLLLTERFRFSSDAEAGLELVDILTNGLRRALTRNMSPDGWRAMPRLMIHRRQQYPQLIVIGDKAPDGRLPYGDVLGAFSRGGRSMMAA